MANKKFYTVEQEINGKKYVAQFNGVSAALKAVDSTYIDGTNTTSLIQLTEYILKHVVVEPKGLTADDFDSSDELQEVIAFAREVMEGNFREKANEGAAKEKSSK